MPSQPRINRVAVFGGTGFLGRRIVMRLHEAGIIARIAVRRPAAAQNGPGIEAVGCDVRDETAVRAALEDCDVAVNAVGHYVEQGTATFKAVHEVGAQNVARAAHDLSLRCLIHTSGIGVDRSSPSAYVRARAEGELLVRNTFPKAVILRPSVMFAPDDHFVNTLSRIARLTPVIPLFGSGATRLQPVYAGDVADAVVALVKSPCEAGRICELGGPDIFTYRQIIELILRFTNRKRLLMPIPFGLWELLATLCSPLPAPPVTKAQITLLRTDNVVSREALSLMDLKILPSDLGTILPRYKF